MGVHVQQNMHEGRTKLKMNGKWVPIGETDNNAFIVFNIFSCTADYPFLGLEYFRDNPGDANKDDIEWIKNGGKGGVRPSTPKPSGDISLLPTEEPNNTIVKNEIIEPRRTEFPDLFSKNIEKARQDPHKNPPKHYGPSTEEYIDAGNLGNGTGNGNVAPVGFINSGDNDDQMPKDLWSFGWKICRLALFDQLIGELEERYIIDDIEYISVNNAFNSGSDKYSYFPRTFTPKGKTSKWRFIDYSKGSEFEPFKLRKVLVVKIITRQHVFYLFEIERKVVKIQDSWFEKESFATYLAMASRNHLLTTYDIEIILEMCAEQNGAWKASSLKNMPYFKFQTVKHPRNESLEGDDNKYVNDFINTIQKKTGDKFEIRQ